MYEKAELERMAFLPESELIEKKQSRPLGSELRITLVAFANSVRPKDCAVLFIGISPRGAIVGVSDADKDQIEIRRVAEDDCYPAVDCRMSVLEIEGRFVIAVMVPHSRRTPHFTGHAFFRIGSESKKSSEEQLKKLVWARNDTAGILLPLIGKNIYIELRPAIHWSKLNGQSQIELREFKLQYCDAQVVTFEDTRRGRPITERLSHVTVLPARINGCEWKLIIKDPDESQYC